MLIVVEGADGCGKTSVATELAKMLNGECLHFPDDNAVTGPMIREYLKRQWWVSCRAPGEFNDEAGALAFQALQLVNRMEHMPRLLEAASTKAGVPTIVLARYWQSGVVYGELDGLDGQWLKMIHSTLAKPHLNILLDITPEESMRRRAARDGELPPERYEGKLDTTKAVVASYRILWAENNAETKAGPDTSWLVVDTTHRALEDVINKCYVEAHYKYRRLYGTTLE